MPVHANASLQRHRILTLTLLRRRLFMKRNATRFAGVARAVEAWRWPPPGANQAPAHRCPRGHDRAQPTEPSGELTPVRLQLQWVAQIAVRRLLTPRVDQGYLRRRRPGRDHPRRRGRNRAAAGAGLRRRRVLHCLGAQGAGQSRAEGADLVNIGQVFQRSGTLEVSWADSGINSVEDWAASGWAVGLRQRARAVRRPARRPASTPRTPTT